MHMIVALIIFAVTVQFTYETLQVKIERILLPFLNEEYADAHLSVAKVTKTDYGLIGNITLFKDIPNDVKYSAYLFAEFSNTYRRMPYNLNGDLCKQLQADGNADINKKFKKFSNFTFLCPFNKGYYYVDKMVIGALEAPDLPWDKLMFDINITLQNGLPLLHTQAYIVIEHDQMFIKRMLGK